MAAPGLVAWRCGGPPATPAGERLRATFVAVLVLVSAATLMTTVVYVPAVAQLYVWRLAPFGVLLALVSLSAWLAVGAPVPGEHPRPKRVAATLLLVVGTAAIAWRAAPSLRWAAGALALMAALCVAGRLGARCATAVAGLGAVLLALGLAQGLPGLRKEATALGLP